LKISWVITMNVEEIKTQYLMTDVLSMYGLRPNRSGFIFCPFHNEKGHASCKIYKKDFHCFGCGQNGDIFVFIQNMENCSFKEAFLKLGGHYEEKSDFQRRKFEYELQMKKQKEQREIQKRKQFKKDILDDIRYQKLFEQCFPVFSDDWCKAINKKEYDFYLLGELQQEGG